MATIRPIIESDKKNLSGNVTGSILTNPDDSVVSQSIFGRTMFDDRERASQGSVESQFVSSDIYNRRGYIQLALPVVNMFLAGAGFEVWKAVLSTMVKNANGEWVESSYDIQRIIEGSVLYDTVTGKEITVSDIEKCDIEYSSNILIGGQYLKFLLDCVDVDQRIITKLTALVYKAINRSYGVSFLGKIGSSSNSWLQISTEASNGVKLVDGFYLHHNLPVDNNKLMVAFDKLLAKEFNRYYSALALLLSLRGNDIHKLSDQIQNFIVVPPVGFRPAFQGRHDKITKAYNNIVMLNNNLKSMLLSSSVKLSTVRDAYAELVRAIMHVTVKSQNTYDKHYKPKAETLIGKKGLIRDRMQGVRIDYSGRSVITVDPNMSVDTIGVPIVMAERLMGADILRKYRTEGLNKSALFLESNKKLREELAKKALEETFAITGRQPTLYRLGIQAFKVKLVEGNAIVLNPLITPAYNADFDGDQMHISVPVGEGAKEEAKHLLASTNNVFLGRSGECHIAPRQELIYGLWKAHTIKAGQQHKHDLRDLDEDMREELLEQERTQGYPYRLAYKDVIADPQDEENDGIITDIKVGKKFIDELTVYEGVTITVGEAAIRSCFSKKISNIALGVSPIVICDSLEEAHSVEVKCGNKSVTESWFKEAIGYVAMHEKARYVPTVNRLVKLAFVVASIYPPSIPVLNFPDMTDLIAEFDSKVKEREELYYRGFDTEAGYTRFYDEAYKKLQKDVAARVASSIPKENGYRQMIDSGARGKMTVLNQLFGIKGQISKNSVDSFTAAILKPLAKQLNGLEHYITAYGGRQGLMDKSIETYKPGYLAHVMGHTASPCVISVEDCGTTDGLELDYQFVKQFVPQNNLTKIEEGNNEHVRKYFVKMVTGRYIVGLNSEIKTAEQAGDIYDRYVARIENNQFKELGGVKLRSPLTCKNPCCVKCYGINLGTNTEAVPGFPAGFEAATSIGEPGTQLTMKNFQSGGVAGTKNLTSSFDTLQDYLRMIDLYKRAKDNRVMTYDFLSDRDGTIRTSEMNNGTKRLYIEGDNGKTFNENVFIPSDIELKTHVKRGESIFVKQGDYNIHEIIDRKSVDEAARYLVCKLYSIFERETFVNLKHFEVLVSGMIFHICIRGNKYFKSGHQYIGTEIASHDTTGCTFVKTMHGINQVPLFRNDVFSTVVLENVRKGLVRSVIMSGKDEMKLPQVRYSFGLRMNLGTQYNGYLKGRSDER